MMDVSLLEFAICTVFAITNVTFIILLCLKKKKRLLDFNSQKDENSTDKEIGVSSESHSAGLSVDASGANGGYEDMEKIGNFLQVSNYTVCTNLTQNGLTEDSNFGRALKTDVESEPPGQEFGCYSAIGDVNYGGGYSRGASDESNTDSMEYGYASVEKTLTDAMRTKQNVGDTNNIYAVLECPTDVTSTDDLNQISGSGKDLVALPTPYVGVDNFAPSGETALYSKVNKKKKEQDPQDNQNSSISQNLFNTVITIDRTSQMQSNKSDGCRQVADRSSPNESNIDSVGYGYSSTENTLSDAIPTKQNVGDTNNIYAVLECPTDVTSTDDLNQISGPEKDLVVLPTSYVGVDNFTPSGETALYSKVNKKKKEQDPQDNPNHSTNQNLSNVVTKIERTTQVPSNEIYENAVVCLNMDRKILRHSVAGIATRSNNQSGRSKSCVEVLDSKQVAVRVDEVAVENELLPAVPNPKSCENIYSMIDDDFEAEIVEKVGVDNGVLSEHVEEVMYKL